MGHEYINPFSTMTPLTLALFVLANILIVGGVICLVIAILTGRRPDLAGWPMVAGLFVLAAMVASHAFL